MARTWWWPRETWRCGGRIPARRWSCSSTAASRSCWATPTATSPGTTLAAPTASASTGSATSWRGPGTSWGPSGRASSASSPSACASRRAGGRTSTSVTRIRGTSRTRSTPPWTRRPCDASSPTSMRRRARSATCTSPTGAASGGCCWPTWPRPEFHVTATSGPPTDSSPGPREAGGCRSAGCGTRCGGRRRPSPRGGCRGGHCWCTSCSRPGTATTEPCSRQHAGTRGFPPSGAVRASRRSGI